MVHLLQPLPARFKITQPVVHLASILLNPDHDFPFNCYLHFRLIPAVANVLKESLDNLDDMGRDVFKRLLHPDHICVIDQSDFPQ